MLLLDGDMVRLMVGGSREEVWDGRVYDADARARLTRAVALIGNNELERHLTCTAKPEASFGGG